MTIAVAVSGGADSLYAMASLQREYPGQVIAFHALQKETSPEDDPVPGLEASCRALGVPLHILDLQEAFFRQIVRPFAESYAHGETPNPCVRCNALVKFGLWMDEARKLGADRLATGHYVSLAEHPRYGMALHQGADEAKDQSYFLCQLSQEQLRYALFPVGGLLKPEVRRIAEEQGLATARRKDSQGICFVGKVDLPVFLQQKLASKRGNIHEILPSWPKYRRSGLPGAGPELPETRPSGTGGPETEAGHPEAGQTAWSAERPDTAFGHTEATGKEQPTRTEQPADAATETTVPAAGEGATEPTDAELAALAAPWRYTVRDGKKIGEHNGAHFYTIGQRKGLGIGGRRESLFILATDVTQNVIYVGEGDAHPGLWRPALHIAPGDVHWVNPARAMAPGESRRFRVRIRYRQPLQEARLFMRGNGVYLLFDTPQRGITPGQFAAWYDGDELVGSGVIEA